MQFELRIADGDLGIGWLLTDYINALRAEANARLLWNVYPQPDTAESWRITVVSLAHIGRQLEIVLDARDSAHTQQAAVA